MSAPVPPHGPWPQPPTVPPNASQFPAQPQIMQQHPAPPQHAQQQHPAPPPPQQQQQFPLQQHPVPPQQAQQQFPPHLGQPHPAHARPQQPFPLQLAQPYHPAQAHPVQPPVPQHPTPPPPPHPHPAQAQAGPMHLTHGPASAIPASTRPPGPFGYPYREMPQYPAPSFPPQHHRPRSARRAWTILVGTFLLLAVAATWSMVALRDTIDPTADPTVLPTGDGHGLPNTSPTGTFGGEFLVEQLNVALANRDRETFFRYVDGAAAEPLNLWWDNMEVLHWTQGAISVLPDQPDEYSDDSIQLTVLLGAVTAGSPTIPEDSDHPAAGLHYAPSNYYTATIHVTDDGESGVLTGWEAAAETAPWDLAPLYAVFTEHAVMAGYEDEADLVDSVSGVVEESAQWVIDTYEAETGVANAQAFLTFVTEDDSRFNEWFLSEYQNSGWVSDRAGTMFPQARPMDAPGISPTIATGGYETNAGGILTVGPSGLRYGLNDTQDTITHEFIHAMHYTNVARPRSAGSPVTEGWATYNESLFQGDGQYANRFSLTGRTVRGCVADDFSGAFPVQDDFVSVETVGCAYALSGSMYAYAESIGIDVYELADLALERGEDLPDAALELGDRAIEEDEWADWLRENYG